ncbi:MAG: DoxX family protein [Bacteroidetes bacterium]|nr:DoxX family protein [Bacteroidota bacterium]
MNKIFSTAYNRSLADLWLLLLRLGVGGFMLTHGFPKLQKLLEGGEIQFMDFMGLGTTASLALVVFAEAFCSVLLILGLSTRLASLVLAITMGVAAFMAHGADPFAKKEMALLYLLIYLTLLVFGPGKYALDSLLAGKVGGKKKPAKAKK